MPPTPACDARRAPAPLSPDFLTDVPLNPACPLPVILAIPLPGVNTTSGIDCRGEAQNGQARGPGPTTYRPDSSQP